MRIDSTPFALACALAACMSCGEPGPGEDRPPNIVLISVDTLRADAVGAYGDPEAVTPFIDSLAEDGVRFERAYAPSSWTAPSIASLLTSLDPHTHGVSTGVSKLGGVVRQPVLAPQIQTLAEALKGIGYRTYAVVTNGHLIAELGFAQGFDRYEHLNRLGWESDGTNITQHAVGMREEIVEGETPYFLWLHYYDPHHDYRLRSPWAEARLASEEEGLCDAFPSEVPGAPQYRNHWLRCARLAYASEVSAVDDAIREAFSGLGVSGSDLIVLTADHGEEFLEHRGAGHRRTLYEEVVRIPLIMRLPHAKAAGSVVSEAVSLLDVMPSVLDYAGAASPGGAQGASLLDFIEGEGRERSVILSLQRANEQRISVIVDGAWKLISTFTKPRLELYDLQHDPAEKQNLTTREREVARSLEAKLTAAVAELKGTRIQGVKERTFSAEEVEQLKAMGYVEESP